jgi:hypothetical protein
MTNIATFNSVGVSRQFGKLKIRMANDIEWRQFMLKREGHTDIQLIQLGEQLSKVEAVQRAQTATTIAEDGSLVPTFGDEAQACFTRYLEQMGVIEKPKKKRGRPARAVAEAAEPVAEEAQPQVADDAASVELPTEALVQAVTLTLDDIPKRDEKGRLLSGKTRQLMLEERLAALEEVA